MATNVIAENYIGNLSSTLMIMLIYYGLKDKIESGKFNEQPLIDNNLPLSYLYTLNLRTTVMKLILNPFCVSLFFIIEANWPALVFILLNLVLIIHCSHIGIKTIGVILGQMTTMIDNLKLQEKGQASQQQRQGYQASNVHAPDHDDDSVVIDMADPNIPLQTRIDYMEKQLGGMKKIRTMIRIFLIVAIFSNVSSIGSYWDDWNDCFYDTSDWSYTINGCLYAFTIVGFAQYVFAAPKPPNLTVRQVLCCDGSYQTKTNQYSSMH